MLAIMLSMGMAASTPGPWCLLSAQEGGTSLLIMSPDGRRRGEVEIGPRPHEVEVSPDRKTAWVSQFGITDYDSRIGTPGRYVVEVDLKAGRATRRFELPGGLAAPHGVKLRPGKRELFVNAEVGGDMMLVYDRLSKQVLRRFGLIKGAHNFIFSRDGGVLFVFAGAEGVAKYDASTGQLLAQRRFDGPVRGLRLTRGGEVAAASNGVVLVLDPGTLVPRRTMRAPDAGQLVYLETLADGSIVAPSQANGGVFRFGPGGEGRFIATGKTPINVRQGPDGQLYVANVDDDHLTVMSQSGASVRQIGKIDGPNGLGFGACPARPGKRRH